MKRLLAILILLMPTFAWAQPQGWLAIAIQGDAYGPETTWLLRDSTEEIVAGSAPLEGQYPYVEAFLPLPPGDYTFTIYDTFGDGICCGFGEGWFSLNTCTLDTTVYDFNSSELSVPLEILPCPPPIFGCMDPQALDYNPWATAPGPCSFPPEQCGDGESNIVVTVTPDTYAGEISWDLMSFPDGEILMSGEGYTTPGIPVLESICLPVGAQFKVNVYDTFGDGMCGSCYGGIDGNISVTTLCQDTLYYVGDTLQFESVGSDILSVPECILQIPEGCTDAWFTEYDPEAIIDDGSCETEVILGCTDSTAVNYNPDANTLETENNCLFTLTLTDGAGDGWFGSWLGVIQGDEIFGPFQMGPNDGMEQSFEIPLYTGEAIEVLFFTGGNAETTAAQCGFYVEGPQGIVVEGGSNPWADAIKKFPYRYTGVPFCDDFCIEAVLGCTDVEACNYNAEANVEGDCTFPIEYYNCLNECIFDSDEDGVCDELEVTGCMDPTAFNYNELATDPGMCEPFIFGCTDPTMFNYDASANTDNGSCVPVVLGCTDPLAFNYDPNANTDSGGCIAVVAGCMDVDAYNFDILANVANNNSCLYEAVGCVTGLGEPYGDGFWLNDSCFAWVIEVDPFCCDTEWDSSCQELHTYCEAGWPTDVTEVSHTIRVYPNPVRDQLHISCANLESVCAYNMQGQEIYRGTATVVPTALWPAGVYTLRVAAYLRNYNIKIVKQ